MLSPRRATQDLGIYNKGLASLYGVQIARLTCGHTDKHMDVHMDKGTNRRHRQALREHELQCGGSIRLSESVDGPVQRKADALLEDSHQVIKNKL